MNKTETAYPTASGRFSSYDLFSIIGTAALSFYILFNKIATEDLYYAGLIGIIVICFLANRGWNVFANRKVIIFSSLYAAFLFIAFMLATTGEFSLAMHFFKGHTFAFLSFLFLASIRRTSANDTMRVIAYMSFIMMAVVAGLYFTSKPDYIFSDLVERRMSGFTEHANQFYIVLLVPGVIGMYIFRHEKVKFFLFASLMFLLVLLTGSKTGMATTALVFLGFSLSFFFNKKIGVIAKFGYFLVFLLLMPAAFLAGQSILKALNPYYYANLEKVLTNPSASSTVLERRQILEKGLELFTNSPLIGIGPNQQIRYISVTHFHNFILDYLVTFGIPGTALIIAMMVFTCIQAVKGRNTILVAALGVLVLTTLSSDSLGRTFMFFAIIAGIALRSAPRVPNLSRPGFKPGLRTPSGGAQRARVPAQPN